MSVFEDIQSVDQQYVCHSYGRFPVAVKNGKNAVCHDFDGKRYIDFTSGIGVNSLGFCDSGWIKAVTEQLGRLQHISNLYYTEPCGQLAKMLCERTGLKKVFFANGGAEANEGAIKAARKYSFDRYGKGRDKILTLVNSFHGRTVTTLSATGQDVFHNYFFPFTEGFEHIPAGDFEALKSHSEGACALMVELIQGEGGVIPVEPEYVKKAAEFCRENDILLIVDEVQTGIGRTGSLFCFEQYGIEPDIVTAAKGIGGGLPLAAVLFGKKTENVFNPGDHATTFGGNPAICAGGVEIVNRLDKDFLNEVKKKGDYIRERVIKMPHVTGTSGMGLMIGIALEEGYKPADVVKSGISEGVLLLTAKTKVRLLPPLTITYEEIDEGLAALERALG